MNRSINSIFRIAVVGLSLAGCGTFSPRPDPSRFFTLSSLPQVAQGSLKNSTGLEKMFLGHRPDQVSRLSRSTRNSRPKRTESVGSF